jgi:hypothetical protein
MSTWQRILFTMAIEVVMILPCLLRTISDVLEAVRIVRQELGYGVGILNPHRKPSVELQRTATFIRPIRQGVLAASQFPDKWPIMSVLFIDLRPGRLRADPFSLTHTTDNHQTALPLLGTIVFVYREP